MSSLFLPARLCSLSSTFFSLSSPTPPRFLVNSLLATGFFLSTAAAGFFLGAAVAFLEAAGSVFIM